MLFKCSKALASLVRGEVCCHKFTFDIWSSSEIVWSLQEQRKVGHLKGSAVCQGLGPWQAGILLLSGQSKKEPYQRGAWEWKLRHKIQVQEVF